MNSPNRNQIHPAACFQAGIARHRQHLDASHLEGFPRGCEYKSTDSYTGSHHIPIEVCAKCGAYLPYRSLKARRDDDRLYHLHPYR